MIRKFWKTFAFQPVIGLFLCVGIGAMISLPARAAITITAVSGASDYNIDTGVAPQVYGGVAGSDCSGTAPNSDGGTCNSCNASALASCGATSPFCACNTRRIYSTGKLHIEFHSDSKAGYAIVLPGDTTQTQGFTLYGSTSNVGIGDTASADIYWSDVCSKGLTSATGATDCSVSGTGSLRVGISPDTSNVYNSNDDLVTLNISIINETTNTVDNCSGSGAICGFWAWPGDGKMYMEQITSSADFPNLPTGKVKYVRVYYSTQGFDKASPTEGSFQDLEIDPDTLEVKSKIVSGLTNDVPYYFRIAAVDEAYNVFNFISDTNITTATDTAGQYGGCSSATNPDPLTDTSCRYVTTPDQVLGLLTKDLNCFIASAAYGSSLAPKLTAFRQFRNRFLLTNSIGRRFVHAYYHYGPYAARWIAPRDGVRAVVRGFLWPLWVFAWMAVHWGLGWAIAVLFSGLTAVAVLLIQLWPDAKRGRIESL